MRRFRWLLFGVVVSTLSSGAWAGPLDDVRRSGVADDQRVDVLHQVAHRLDAIEARLLRLERELGLAKIFPFPEEVERAMQFDRRQRHRPRLDGF